METEQKEAGSEIKQYIELYLPKAIFVLKDLIGDKHEHKKSGFQ